MQKQTQKKCFFKLSLPLLILGLSLISIENSYAAEPGGVSSNLEVWLKADAGITPENNSTKGGNVNDVALWVDQSGKGNDVYQSTHKKKPNLEKDQINFNPALDFDGTNTFLKNIKKSGFSHSYSLVIQPDVLIDKNSPGQALFALDCKTALNISPSDCDNNSLGGFFLGKITGSFSDEILTHLVGTVKRWRSLQTGTASYPAHFPLLIQVNTNTAHSGTDLFVNGLAVNNATKNTHQLISNADFRVGGLESGKRFDGKIAEVIDYSNGLTELQRQKVQSYLALKYGITLNQSIPQSYLASDGFSFMWKKEDSEAGLYSHNIFGVGRDDASQLLQLKSKSVNEDGLLALALENEGSDADPLFSHLDDREFLTLANNKGLFTWSSAGSPNGFELLSRQWKVQQHGADANVGRVNLDFDVADEKFKIPDLLQGTDYYFVYDADADGQLGDEVPLLMSDQGRGIWQISGVSLASNTIFTLATGNNHAPNNLQINAEDSVKIDENLPAQTQIGTLTTADLDEGDTHTYSLACDVVGLDDAHFEILGDQLLSASSFDFEAPTDSNQDGIYEICVRSTDSGVGHLTYDKRFTVSVNNLNQAPSALFINGQNTATQDEGLPINTVIGVLSSTDDAEDNPALYTYSLNCTQPGPDDEHFNIAVTDLRNSSVFDFHNPQDANGDNLYDLCVRVSDGKWTHDETFSIFVNDVKHAPTHIDLGGSNSIHLNENLPAQSIVGTLTASDEDPQDSMVYALSCAQLGLDDDQFQISANQVLTHFSFDFEAPTDSNQDGIYEICVQVSDGEFFYEENLSILLNNLNQAPSALFINGQNTATQDEGLPINTVIGVLSSTDDAEDNPALYTYSLNCTQPGPDDEHFNIAVTDLRNSSVFDFHNPQDANGDNLYDLCIRVSDGKWTHEQNITVSVLESTLLNAQLQQEPLNAELAQNTQADIPESNAAQNPVGLQDLVFSPQNPFVKGCLSYDPDRELTFVDGDINDPATKAAEVLKNTYFLQGNAAAKQYALSGYGSTADVRDSAVEVGLNQTLNRLELAKLLMITHCLSVQDYRILPEIRSNGSILPNYADKPRLGKTEDSWELNVIYSASHQLIFDGTLEGNVEPERFVTTAEGLKMITRVGEFIKGEPLGQSDDLVSSDIDSKAWYFPFLSKTLNEGVVDSKFNRLQAMHQPLKRGEAMILLVNTLLERGVYSAADEERIRAFLAE